MTDRCPHCGGDLTTTKGQETTAETLRRWCLANGHTVMPFDEVREEVAALILDISIEALQNKRYAYGDDFIPFRRHGRSKRLYCTLEDLAAYIDGIRYTRYRK